MMKSFRYATAALLASSLFVAVVDEAAAQTLQGPAPNFTLKSNSGKNVKLSELRGQVVMVNFWASWCGPCRQEMPKLDALYKRYSPIGFTILGVNAEQDSHNAKKLLKDEPVSFPVLFDTEERVSKLYDLSAMPSTVLIDRNGNLRYLHKGYVPGTEREYEQQIKALIRE